MTSAGQAWVRGVAVDWKPAFAGTGAKRVPLPTYAFQRQRYWVERQAGAGDVSALGQAATGHPLLGASIALADGERTLLTGRVSLDSHPWLPTTRSWARCCCPAPASSSWRCAPAARLGCEQVEELTLEAPLVLGDGEAVQLQVTLGAPDGLDRRAIAIYSRVERGDADEPGEWTRHASGFLAPAEESVEAPAELGDQWPPRGAEPVDVDDLYDRVADEVGFLYGPAFQGLRAAWKRGEEVFAEVELDDGQHSDATRFGIHPALFDAVLHTAYLYGDDAGTPRLPFSWSGVRLGATGATALRVRVAATADGLAIDAVDTAGAAVAAVEALVARPVERRQLDAARRAGSDALFDLGWSPVDAAGEGRDRSEGPVAVFGAGGGLAAALAAAGVAVETLAGDGAEAPAAVLIGVDAGAGEDSPAAAARAAVVGALGSLHEFLAHERLAGTRLVVVTRDAVAVRPGERPDPAGAAVWGLVRAAQSEHPGRVVLVDVDGTEESWRAVPAAAAVEDEWQVALRAGEALVPRLVRAEPVVGDTGGRSLDPEGTVLLTGGVSGIGALVARHLASEHGARHLLLTSRRGIESAGAAELAAELTELGCAVRVEACDVSDRGQVEELLGSIAAKHPLTAVFHAAGVLDDGTIESLTAERFDAVLAPKVDGAWHLHELTAGTELAQFVLFSSVAATFGGPGQGNYAAANAFLDALAARRHADGLAATSIAWGLWEQASEMTGDLDDADTARIARAGIAAAGGRAGTRAARPRPRSRRALRGRGAAGSRRAAADRAGRDAAGAAARPGPGAGPPPRRFGGARPQAGGGARGEARRRRVRPRARARRGRARPRGRQLGRPGASLQGPRIRLADGGGAAQPARAGNRPAAAGDAGVRLPDARRGGGVPAVEGRGSRARRAVRSSARGRTTGTRWRSSASAAASPAASRRRSDLWELVAGGGDGDLAVPHRSRLGPEQPRQRRGRARDLVLRRGRVRRRGRRLRRRVLRDRSARGARRWTRSSGCCWRRPGRLSSTPGSTRTRRAARTSACSPA